MTKILYYSPYCPPARSVLLVAKALNLHLKLKEVDLLSESYKNSDFKVNHWNKTVPTLKDNDDYLWDSHAISEYLVNKYGRRSDLRPENVVHKAHIDRILHFDTEYLIPTTCGILFPILFRRKYRISNAVKSLVQDIYARLNGEIQAKWLTGNSPTIADFCCITSLTTLDLIVPVEKNTKLSNYIGQFREFPFYAAGNLDGLNCLAEILLDRIVRNKFNHD